MYPWNIASGCSPGVIPGVIQEVSIGRSCPAGYPRIYCQENTASITKCPTGYVVDGFGWCRQKPNEFVTNIRKSLDEQSKNLAKYKSDLSKYISKITTRRTGSDSLDRFRKGNNKEDPSAKWMQDARHKNNLKQLYNKWCKSIEFEYTSRKWEYENPESWGKSNEYKLISGSQRCLSAMKAGKFAQIRTFSRDCVRLQRETIRSNTGWRRYIDVYKCTL